MPSPSPHKVSAYRYKFKVLKERKHAFRDFIPGFLVECNSELRQIKSLGGVQLKEAQEVLIGNDAGAVIIEWAIDSFAFFENPEALSVLVKLDTALREFIDPNHPFHSCVLGEIVETEEGTHDFLIF